MGRSVTPAFRVEVELAGEFVAATPFCWNPKMDGRANQANLERFVKAHNASIAPDGANAHLGAEHRIVTAFLIRQRDDETVAVALAQD